MINEIYENLKTTNEFNVNSDYFLKYINLIANNINNVKDELFTDCHHIIPRSYYKQYGLEICNEKWNLINLTFTDHILAHYYLFNCCINTDLKQKNAAAVAFMYGKLPKSEKEIIDNQIDLNNVRVYYIQKQHDFMLGSHPSMETIEKRKNTMKLKYENGYVNPNKGKESPLKGIPLSEETKHKISEANKGNTAWNKGMQLSDEYKQKLKESHLRPEYKEKWKDIEIAPRKWITNGIICKKILKEDPIPEGFWAGRLPKTEEEKNIIRNAIIKKYEEDPTYRNRISESVKKTQSENPELLDCIVNSQKGKHPWNYHISPDDPRYKKTGHKKGEFKHSEESKKKMSEAHKGKKPSNSFKVLCVETGEIFDSMGDAARIKCISNNISIVLDKEDRTCGGYHWKRVK